MQAIFEFVMLGGEMVKLLVRLQQQSLQVLRLLIHAPPPLGSFEGVHGMERAMRVHAIGLLGPNVTQASRGFKISRARADPASEPGRFRPVSSSTRGAR